MLNKHRIEESIRYMTIFLEGLVDIRVLINHRFSRLRMEALNICTHLVDFLTVCTNLSSNKMGIKERNMMYFRFVDDNFECEPVHIEDPYGHI